MAFSNDEVAVIGGGLAGVEAALALSKLGVAVALYEMKPARYSPAHRLPALGELVCSNSLKSRGLEQASGLLQEELTRLGSAVMEAAMATSVAAGQSLAVERDRFAALLTAMVEQRKNIRLVREEAVLLPEDRHAILACGPLGSDAILGELSRVTGSGGLYFYDAVAPILDGDSIDLGKAFFASRYGKTSDDYLNCPLDREEWARFYEALTSARTVATRDFEEEKVFQGCQPIETIAATGEKTLRFGPMKPVGLSDPRTGVRPWAVVQLRREDPEGRRWNMVGFQTKLAHPEQERVFRLIPGLENAVFHRLGSLHRNAYVDGPRLLDQHLRLRIKPWIQLAGQITGVEGYLESAAMGLWAGMNLGLRLTGRTPSPPPVETAMGSLIGHVSGAPGKKFEPMNMNFGLLPPLGVNMRDKKESKRLRSERALGALDGWLEEVRG